MTPIILWNNLKHFEMCTCVFLQCLGECNIAYKKRKHSGCDLNLLAHFLLHYLCGMMFILPPLILQLVFQTQFKILELTFKNLSDPKYLRANIFCYDLWLFKSAEEALLKRPRLSNSCLFSISERIFIFFCISPRLWNILPGELHLAPIFGI